MNKAKKGLALMLVALLLFALLPSGAVALGDPVFNQNDLEKLQAFFKQPSANLAETNAQRMAALIAGFDIDKPATWGYLAPNDLYVGVQWHAPRGGHAMRVVQIKLPYPHETAALAGSLDVSGMAKLTKLYCNGNRLASLDVRGCAALEELGCGLNRLISLDVSENKSLARLDCSDNLLTSLDTSGNRSLAFLDCGNNGLTSLDVSRNPALEELYCFDNELAELDLSKSSELWWLDCENNRLSSLDVSKNALLSMLECGQNQLEVLDVSDNAHLSVFYCASNRLSSIDISNNPNLSDLDCASNALRSLDVSKNTALGRLNCSDNLLTELDLNANARLAELRCASNPLNGLILSAEATPEWLDARDTRLKSFYAHIVKPAITLLAEGEGTFSFYYISKKVVESFSYESETRAAGAQFYALAEPSGALAAQWLDENGSVVSNDARYDFAIGKPYALTARFAGAENVQTAEQTLTPVPTAEAEASTDASASSPYSAWYILMPILLFAAVLIFALLRSRHNKINR